MPLNPLQKLLKFSKPKQAEPVTHPVDPKKMACANCGVAHTAEKPIIFSTGPAWSGWFCIPCVGAATTARRMVVPPAPRKVPVKVAHES